MKVLVTGGAGFIGSNFIRYWTSRHPADRVTNLDLLTYAGDREAVREFNKNKKVGFVQGDICDPRTVDRAMKGQDAVFHFAAETHVDRSILDSQVFLRTNVLGTQALLEAARRHQIKKFVFISTDEVYGSIHRGSFKEDDPLLPNSPYAASKAAADLLCRSYWITHGFPVIVTRCSNNFGPRQFPEKVIPLFITNLMEGRKVPVYGKGLNVREWIHVLDHCRAVDRVFRKGKAGEIYNIGSGVEMNNIALARRILSAMGASKDSLDFVKDRPGHDLRYSLDSSKLRRLGWKPQYSFQEAIGETVRWYQRNRPWWTRIKAHQGYKTYIQKQYKS